MTTCVGATTVCTGLDLRPIRRGLRREVVLWCSGCRTKADAMGVTVVERRVAEVPVARDRRAFVAPWRRNLIARDETGAVLR